ncbi:MAG: LicD family protein, partial [Nocardioidaceae bacterium]|nr:LicD family protein [Nocardioidaceae bacterium]
GVPDPLELTTHDEERLRAAQLELLAELDRVCAALGVEYFALYGTLLGAVRHQGFIPWDDDLDVGMLREDYDQLVARVDGELGERFFLQTVDSDPHYGCMFAKLRRNDTRCVDRISYGSAQHSGVFLDIFPLDAKASAPLARTEQKAMRYVGFRLLYLKAGYLFMRGTSLPSRIAQFVARCADRVLPRALVIKFTERHTRLGRKEAPAEYVSLFGAYLYDRDTIDASWIHPLVRVPFENTTIPAPADSAAYLTQIYGDYMTPPPPEQQVGHHEIVELSLAD